MNDRANNSAQAPDPKHDFSPEELRKHLRIKSSAARYENAIQMCRDIADSRRLQYGKSVDKASEIMSILLADVDEPDMYQVANITHMVTKLVRYAHCCHKNTTLRDNQTKQDSLVDLVNYALLTLGDFNDTIWPVYPDGSSVEEEED